MPKIHNHYVPKFYLKGFTEESASEIVFVYQKGKTESFRSQVKNIGNEKGLYTDDLEVILANDIEQSANSVLQKLRDFQSISKDEKLLFARYMFSMSLRVPKRLNWFIKISPKIIEKTYSDAKKQLIDLAQKHPDKAGIVEQHIKRLHETKTEKIDELAKEMWLKNVPSGIDRPPVQMLTNMEWRYLIDEGDQFFLASDNPIFYFESIGLGNEKSEVTFPLAKNLVLWAKWQMNIPPGFHKARTQFVKEVNRRTVSNALKYVFSSQAANWISELLNKKNIRLSRVL